MKLLRVVFLGAAAMLVSSVTNAAEPELDWTGFHIGAGVGVSISSIEDELKYFQESETGGVIGAETSFLRDVEGSKHGHDVGPLGTLETGFDVQINSFVLGALASYDFSDGRVSEDFTGPISRTNPGGTIAGTTTVNDVWKIGNGWMLGGRFGYLVDDDILAYVLGGYTERKVSARSYVSSTLPPESFGELNHPPYDDSSWKAGWVVGGGVETLLTENISLKGEYRYSDLGTSQFSFFSETSNQITTSITDFQRKADLATHSVRAVLSLRLW